MSKTARLLNAAAWTLQLALAAVFVFAGASKLLAKHEMVQMFEQVGFGQWFRFLTGFLELIGGLAIVIPNTAFWAAIVLGTVMAGALATHALIIGGNPFPAAGLLIASGLVAFLRR